MYLTGSQVCHEYLVSGPHGVPDSHLTASSSWNSHLPNDNNGPERSRLFTPAYDYGNGTFYRGAWSAGKNDKNQYIQVMQKSRSLLAINIKKMNSNFLDVFSFDSSSCWSCSCYHCSCFSRPPSICSYIFSSSCSSCPPSCDHGIHVIVGTCIYLQVEFMRPSLVRGVVTQGRHLNPLTLCCVQRTTEFKVSYSIDGKTWIMIKDQNGKDKVIIGIHCSLLCKSHLEEPCSPNILNNILCPFHQGRVNLKPYALSNQKFCYFQMILDIEKNLENTLQNGW